MAARLKEQYQETLRGELMQELGRKNVMNVPKLEKIVVNMGIGDSQTEPRYLEEAMESLAMITGQKGSIRTARRSIAGFKVREGAKIGCTVTLRGNRMYEFLDRLLNIAIPRIRDFRGLSPKSFDKEGNYTMGVRE
ncbi:MAG: 50S ribosomal protein L5, partial [Candidatus Hydrogenedentes bacterium]|nr:50S ribosomal protein L5 [Candidatus Hydrogenedentota bacterium]